MNTPTTQAYINQSINLPKNKTYRIDVGLLGGRAGLEFPFKLNPYGVLGVTGKAGVSGRGEPAIDVSGSVSDRYDENDSSRTFIE